MKKIKLNLLIITLFSFIFGCVQDDKNGGRKKSIPITSADQIGGDNNTNTDNDSVIGNDDTTTGGPTLGFEGTVQLRHIVDPFDGTFKTKVTIPQNFSGKLHISGLNISSLRDKLVYVRLNFGRDMHPVVIPATIGRTSGLIPQTNIEVLTMDLRAGAREEDYLGKIRLLYDLYDYREYSNDTEAAISDPRDGDLYCRGLQVQHDPTFNYSVNNLLCDQADETCLYAYAKIKDNGLVFDSAGADIASLPQEPQFFSAVGGFSDESTSENLLKCLPDNGRIFTNAGNLSNNSGHSLAVPTLPSSAIPSVVLVDSATNYTYNGPYRNISESQWEIRDDAIYGSKGIYDQSFVFSNAQARGIHSYLFPISGKLKVQAGTYYLGDVNRRVLPTAMRTIQQALSDGESEFVDGCNIRVKSYNPNTNLNISSCNVSATIDLIAVDQTTGATTVFTSSKDIKLQIIRSSSENFRGDEVLAENFNSCSDSSSCGPNECCYNNRCWSKDIVSQCLEDSNSFGNLGIGETCSTDYQCSSLCCNRSTGLCGIHNTISDSPVYCSKPPGDSCVASDWCRKDNLRKCEIVKTGVNASGQLTCALRCYNVQKSGQCTNGQCVAPLPDPIPVFNPADCSAAKDPSVLGLD